MGTGKASGPGAWLKKAYKAVENAYLDAEDKYYEFMDYLNDREHFPVYKYYVNPLEDNGIRSFPVTVCLAIALVAGIALMLSQTNPAGVTVVVYSTSGDRVAYAPVVLTVLSEGQGQEVEIGKTDEKGELVISPQNVLPSGPETSLEATDPNSNNKGSAPFTADAHNRVIIFIGSLRGPLGGQGLLGAPGAQYNVNCMSPPPKPCDAAVYDYARCAYDISKCGAKWKDAGAGKLYMKIIDAETGKSIPNSEIRIYDAKTSALESTATLPAGETTIFLQTGVYYFNAVADGYKSKLDSLPAYGIEPKSDGVVEIRLGKLPDTATSRLTAVDKDRKQLADVVFTAFEKGTANPLSADKTPMPELVLQLSRSRDYFFTASKTGYSTAASASFKGGADASVTLLAAETGSQCQVTADKAEYLPQEDIAVTIVRNGMTGTGASVTCAPGATPVAASCTETACTAKCKALATAGSQSIQGDITTPTGKAACVPKTVGIKTVPPSPSCGIGVTPASTTPSQPVKVTIAYSNAPHLAGTQWNLKVDCGEGAADATAGCTGSDGECQASCDYKGVDFGSADSKVEVVEVSDAGSCSGAVIVSKASAPVNDLEVKTVDKAGAAVPSARVWLYQVLDGTPYPFGDARTTGAAGTTTFAGIPLGEYEAYAVAETGKGTLIGKARQSVYGKTEMQVTMEEALATFDFRISDSTGAPISGASVVVKGCFDPADPVQNGGCITNPVGECSVEVPAYSPTCRAALYAEGYNPKIIDLPTLPPKAEMPIYAVLEKAVTCGTLHQACCAGNSCNIGLACEGGYCNAPSECNKNVPPCCSGSCPLQPSTVTASQATISTCYSTDKFIPTPSNVNLLVDCKQENTITLSNAVCSGDRQVTFTSRMDGPASACFEASGNGYKLKPGCTETQATLVIGTEGRTVTVPIEIFYSCEGGGPTNPTECPELTCTYLPSTGENKLQLGNPVATGTTNPGNAFDGSAATEATMTGSATLAAFLPASSSVTKFVIDYSNPLYPDSGAPAYPGTSPPPITARIFVGQGSTVNPATECEVGIVKLTTGVNHAEFPLSLISQQAVKAGYVALRTYPGLSLWNVGIREFTAYGSAPADYCPTTPPITSPPPQPTPTPPTTPGPNCKPATPDSPACQYLSPAASAAKMTPTGTLTSGTVTSPDAAIDGNTALYTTTISKGGAFAVVLPKRMAVTKVKVYATIPYAERPGLDGYSFSISAGTGATLDKTKECPVGASLYSLSPGKEIYNTHPVEVIPGKPAVAADYVVIRPGTLNPFNPMEVAEVEVYGGESTAETDAVCPPGTQCASAPACEYATVSGTGQPIPLGSATGTMTDVDHSFDGQAASTSLTGGQEDKLVSYFPAKTALTGADISYAWNLDTGTGLPGSAQYTFFLPVTVSVGRGTVPSKENECVVFNGGIPGIPGRNNIHHLAFVTTTGKAAAGDYLAIRTKPFEVYDFSNNRLYGPGYAPAAPLEITGVTVDGSAAYSPSSYCPTPTPPVNPPVNPPSNPNTNPTPNPTPNPPATPTPTPPVACMTVMSCVELPDGSHSFKTECCPGDKCVDMSLCTSQCPAYSCTSPPSNCPGTKISSCPPGCSIVTSGNCYYTYCPNQMGGVMIPLDTTCVTTGTDLAI